jgi:hypothetical protein
VEQPLAQGPDEEGATDGTPIGARLELICFLSPVYPNISTCLCIEMRSSFNLKSSFIGRQHHQLLQLPILRQLKRQGSNSNNISLPTLVPIRASKLPLALAVENIIMPRAVGTGTFLLLPNASKVLYLYGNDCFVNM